MREQGKKRVHLPRSQTSNWLYVKHDLPSAPTNYISFNSFFTPNHSSRYLLINSHNWAPQPQLNSSLLSSFVQDFLKISTMDRLKLVSFSISTQRSSSTTPHHTHSHTLPSRPQNTKQRKEPTDTQTPSHISSARYKSAIPHPYTS